MIHVTNHATIRYQERVEDVSQEVAVQRLKCRAVEAAAEFGAHFVKLPKGQRIVLDEATVVTVLPSEHPHIGMSIERTNQHREKWKTG